MNPGGDNMEWATANDLRILAEEQAREALVLREERRWRSRGLHPSNGGEEPT